MNGFVIRKGIGGMNGYRKPIVAAFIVAVIMGVFVGCGKEPVKASPPVPELELLSKQIKQLVKGLEYSDKVAEDFVKMVTGWKNAGGQTVLVVWKQKLNQARQDYKQDKISKDQLAKIEESIVKELSQSIQKEIVPGERFCDLVDVIKHKQTQCAGYLQMVYVLGNSIGLSVRAIGVLELMSPGPLPAEQGHIACIISLTDGKTMMVDLAFRSTISKPFKLEEEFTKVGNYWELKGKDNPLGIHRRIQILDKNGIIAWIYNNRGAAYYNLGQPTKAISDLTKAIELNPKLAEAYSNRGLVYDNLGQYTQAISDYTKAIELNPKYAEAYSSRGLTYYNLGKHTQAISDCTKAIELNPKYAEAYYSRGTIYVNLGKHTQAISDCTKAIELNPKYAEAYGNRGLTYYKLGQYTQAISDYTKTIELNPKDAQAYYNRGLAYRKLGQYTQAISDFTKAIELNPKFADAYYNRGVVYANLGQYTQAISDFTKAIKLNPKFAEAYYGRGAAYAFLGKFEEAKKDLLKALELDPSLKSFIKKISDRFNLGLKLD